MPAVRTRSTQARGRSRRPAPPVKCAPTVSTVATPPSPPSPPRTVVGPEAVPLPIAPHIPPQNPGDGTTEYKMMGRYHVKRGTWELFHRAMTQQYGSAHGHTNECLDMALELWSRSILAARNAFI